MSAPYSAARAIASPPLRRMYHVDVEGVQNVPPAGPVILCANHRSFMDSIFLAMTAPRPISFLAKAEYWERRATRWFVRGCGSIPIRRGSPAAAREAIAAAADVLAEGGTVGIYPEGTRSRDGRLHRGHHGPVRLARATGAAIIPVGLVGTDAVQAPGDRVPRPYGDVTVRFGQPMRPGDAADVRAYTTDLMLDIADLCGQEYDGVYAAAPA